MSSIEKICEPAVRKALAGKLHPNEVSDIARRKRSYATVGVDFGFDISILEFLESGLASIRFALQEHDVRKWAECAKQLEIGAEDLSAAIEFKKSGKCEHCGGRGEVEILVDFGRCVDSCPACNGNGKADHARGQF